MRNPAAVQLIAEKLGLTVWPSFLERACDDRREKFYNGGWRGGKTVSADLDVFMEVYLKDLQTPGNHLTWLISPDYEQAKPDFHNLEDWFTRLGIPVQASQAQEGSLVMTVTRPGKPGTATIVTKSANHPQTLGAVGPKRLLACEAGQMSDAARDRIRGRTSTFNAPIIWNGTFENDEGKPQFSWFEEESKQYAEHPTTRRKAYSLPIWENIGQFGDCREMVEEDPTLALFCPDSDHGPGHSGIDVEHPLLIPGTSGVPRHPKVRELYEECRDKPTYWKKYYAGEAVGVLNPIYEWATVNPAAYLRPMPQALKEKGYRWLRTAGGMDFGAVHPSAIVLGSVDQHGNTWVRKCALDSSGSVNWVWLMARRWSREYGVPSHMWGRDPMMRHVPTDLDGETLSGSLYQREQRVGIVEGARLNEMGQPRLFFDSTEPEVVLLFGEIQRIHWKRQANGKLGYDRVNDDRAAAFEDMMAMLHNPALLQNLPRKWTLPAYRKRPAMTMRSVS